VLEALHSADDRGGGDDGDGALTAVTGAHLARALDDLLDSAQGVTRTLLGVGVDPATLPAGGLPGGPGVDAMLMARRRSMVNRAFYRG
jgi:hypothetical protein